MEILANAIRQEKETESMQIRKKEINSLFGDDMTVYVKILKI